MFSRCYIICGINYCKSLTSFKKSKRWNELFPNSISFIVFSLYIFFCVLHGLIISASQENNNSYNYNYLIVVLLTDLLKLISSFLLYLKNNTVSSFTCQIANNYNYCWLYLIPAFLYCIYNNLSFVSLSEFDPPTYSLLLQVRVVITGILFQILFKRKLSVIQWISLLILMSGCMIKQINLSNDWNVNLNHTDISFSFGFNICFILIQVLCSCTAGVYNEYLLKKNGGSVDTLIQNVCMYFDSILVNSIIILFKYDWNDIANVNTMRELTELKVILVMVNNTALGITTSFFLKNLNSILKTFASALELSLVAIFSRLFLGVPLLVNTIVSICIVSLAVLIYTQNPVASTNLTKDEERKKCKIAYENV